jgi:hypothetical protein
MQYPLLLDQEAPETEDVDLLTILKGNYCRFHRIVKRVEKVWIEIRRIILLGQHLLEIKM